MKTFVAIMMGFLSGLLIYMEAAMLYINPYKFQTPGTLFVMATLLGGWVITTWLIRKNARTVSKVFSRGFLVGAAEWFLMIPVGIIYAGRSATSMTEKVSEIATENLTVMDTSTMVATQIGSMIGGGILAFLTGGIAIGMSILCLIGFAISYFMGREMKPE